MQNCGGKIIYEYKTFDFNIRILREGVSLFLFIVSYFIMGICLRHGLLSLWKNYVVSESAAEKRTMFCCVKTLSGLIGLCWKNCSMSISDSRK